MNNDPFLFIVMIFSLVGISIGLMIQILFYLTLSRCLTRVQLHNRDMDPGLVWLNLIPCFHLIWLFITVSRIAGSLRKEFEDRGWRTGDESFGNGVGMAYASLLLVCMIPYVNLLVGLPAFICFIIYWVQIAGYSNRLLMRATSRRDDDYGRERRYDDDDYRERWNRDDRDDRDYRRRDDRDRNY